MPLKLNIDNAAAVILDLFEKGLESRCINARCLRVAMRGAYCVPETFKGV